jgi:tetratricopeptide (TPR) repeat protein
MKAVTVLLTTLLLGATALASESSSEMDTTSTPDGGAEPQANAVDRDGAARLSRRALARIKDSSWEDAAELLRQARARDPGNAAIATDLAFALAHLGRRDEAERFYRAAIDLDPKRFYAYANLAELWTSDPTRWQRHADMVAFLQKALQTLAGDARAHAFIQLRLAELLRSLGRPDEARTHLQPLTASTVPLQIRRRAQELAQSLDADAGDRALEDWPLPSVPAADKAKLATASAEKDSREALKTLDALVARWPAWTDARWARAQLLERMGQLDEASGDLTIVVQLAPSHARAWRHLGMLLAQHGGGFEAERADEALRHALALEPSWSDLRELRKQVATKRARGGRRTSGERAPEPTAKARQLLQDAQSWMSMEAPEMAPPLLQQALAESPTFVEAAAAFYSIEHTVPEATVKALWNDGNGLWQLVQAVDALRSREAGALARPWVDRAVELGVEEARFARASLRAAAGDKSGALEDLCDYVATFPSPPRLEEARALRLTLTTSNGDSPERLAHGKLAQDKPSEALAALGGSCRKGLPFDSLLAIGRVHEFMGNATSALNCYQLAIDGSSAVTSEHKQHARQRLSAAATALAVSELGRFRPSLELALKAHVPLAAFSLARLAEAQNDSAQATTLVRAFLDGADADDPRLVEARALQARVGKVIENEIEQGNRRSERIRVLVALLVVALLVGLFARRRYRQPISRALRSQPLLFPVLSQTIGQIRHDVLKHRASALELLADPATNRRDVARALLEPEPASTMVASIYQHLAQEARGLGLRLCTLAHEPVFGPLIADLSRAESLLQDDSPSVIEDLRAIDERLRGVHADRLQQLLLSGPRTTVGAGLLARWIDAMTNEPNRGPWTAPQLNLKDAEISFPLPESTLSSIFSNLLRNAIAAATDEPNAAVEVRVEQSRDSMGKRVVSLLIADSSSQPLEVVDIDNRPADRGLGIVRETTRAWGGEIIAHDEPSPFRKIVGVRFAAPAEAKP